MKCIFKLYKLVYTINSKHFVGGGECIIHTLQVVEVTQLVSGPDIDQLETIKMFTKLHVVCVHNAEKEYVDLPNLRGTIPSVSHMCLIAD